MGLTIMQVSICRTETCHIQVQCSNRFILHCSNFVTVETTEESLIQVFQRQTIVKQTN